MQLPPTAPGRANENSRPGQQLWALCTLDPQGMRYKKAPLSCAQTYPLSLNYGQCLGHEEDPYSFASLFLEDLHSGRKEYLVNIQQLVDALPKSLDPTSRFALRAQVTLQGINVCLIPCEPRYGGSYHQMRSSGEHRMEPSIICHARDGVWSCEGVMSPKPISEAA